MAASGQPAPNSSADRPGAGQSPGETAPERMPEPASEHAEDRHEPAEDRAPARRRRGHRRVSAPGTAAAAAPGLDLKAAEDEPASWGDRAEDRDSWLKEQRPPHWG